MRLPSGLDRTRRLDLWRAVQLLHNVPVYGQRETRIVAELASDVDHVAALVQQQRREAVAQIDGRARCSPLDLSGRAKARRRTTGRPGASTPLRRQPGKRAPSLLACRLRASIPRDRGAVHPAGAPCDWPLSWWPFLRRRRSSAAQGSCSLARRPNAAPGPRQDTVTCTLRSARFPHSRSGGRSVPGIGPSGQLLLLEHVRSPAPIVRGGQ